MPASWPPTCPTRSRSSASASPRSPSVASRASASGSPFATATARPSDRIRSLNEPPIEQRLAAAGLPPLPRTAWIELDVGALAVNLTTLRELAGHGTPIHPVVKADAYGHGAVPIARALAEAGADGFCVATLDEAFVLRRSGIGLPILVLYAIPPGMAAAAREARVAVTAGDWTLLAQLLVAVDGGNEPPLEVQLEVETGLGRGGLTGKTLREAA